MWVNTRDIKLGYRIIEWIRKDNEVIEYKYIFYNNYILLSIGKIFSIYKNGFLKSRLSKGYSSVHLRYGEKHRTDRIHVLLGENFIINDDSENRKNVDRSNQYKRKVQKFDLDGNFIKEYNSIKDAAIASDICRVSIGSCCSGRSKYVKDKDGAKNIWKYAEVRERIPIPEGAKLIMIPKETLYYATTEGKVYTTYLENYLKPELDKDGYQHAHLTTGMYLVHKLIMMTFCDNKPEGWEQMEVNHLNGIRNDNRFENLEYATHSRNVLHSIYVLGNGACKPVNMIDRNTKEIIKTFASMKLAR